LIEKRELASEFSKEMIYDYWLKSYFENYPTENYSTKLNQYRNVYEN